MASDPKERIAKSGMRFGRFEVESHLATGGMGSVFRARDVESGRVVALKVLAASMAANPDMVERFRREARAARKLRHENIVELVDFGEAHDTFYLAMEFVRGTDLHNFIHDQANDQLPVAVALSILVQATRALDHAHRQGIVHRDIKPSNFLIAEEGNGLQVKLADFGLAREADDEEFRITKAGKTLGTVDYMAPEQAKDSGRADIRSDLYALGCTFFHMLAGRAPFNQGSLPERILQHMHSDPPDIRQINAAVPDRVAEILGLLLAKKPRDRYQTPWELLVDLEGPQRLKEYLRAHPEIAAEKPSLTAGRIFGAIAGTADGESFLPDEIGFSEEPEAPSVPASSASSPPVSSPPAAASNEPKAPRKAKEGRRAPAATTDEGRGEKTVAARASKEPEKREPAPRKEPEPTCKEPEPRRSEAKTEPESSPRKAKKKKQSGTPLAVLAGILLAFAGILGGVLYVAFGRKPREDNTVVQPSDPKPRPLKIDPTPPESETKSPFVGPIEEELKPFYQPIFPVDAMTLQKEFLGDFGPFPEAAPAAKLVRVSRMPQPGLDSVATIAEAWRKLADATVIEIHDQGPLYLGSLPKVVGRSIVLRAGPGYRPLLVWEPHGDAPWFQSTGGQIVLEDLDLAVRWADGRNNASSAMFLMEGGSFAARRCTMAAAGTHAKGIEAVRIEPASGVPFARVHFAQCYLHGSSLAAASIRNRSAQILLEDALIAGGDQPLFQFVGREEDAIALRTIRSTLATNGRLIRSAGLPGKEGSPKISLHALDSIWSHAGESADDADMIVMEAGAISKNVSWRGTNVAFPGWKRLLVASDRSCLSFEDWRGLHGHREGDVAPTAGWPDAALRTDDLAAAAFEPRNPALRFAAFTAKGPIGASAILFPPAPFGWAARTFDRLPIVPPSLAAEAEPTERLEITADRIDLGAYLAARTANLPAGSRVAITLAGKGPAATSPIRLKGIHLALRVEPDVGPKADPLVFVLKQPAVGRPGYFEILDGSLELVGARLHFDNARVPIPPAMIHAQNSDVRLVRCRLTGPLSNAPETYRTLLDFRATEGIDDRFRTLAIADSLLLSGRSLIEFRGQGIRGRIRQSLGMAMGDALAFDLEKWDLPNPNTAVMLEQSTFAVGRSLVSAQSSGTAPCRKPATVQATSCYVVQPSPVFGPATLLRWQGPVLSRGEFFWQGKDNAYALDAFYAPTGAIATKQTLADWRELIGAPAEQRSLATAPPTFGKGFVFDFPPLPLLVPPPALKLDPPAGADLSKLGIVKTK